MTLGQFILQSCVIVAKLQDFDEKRLTFFHHFFSNSSQIANTTETLKKIVCSFFVRNGGFFVELFSYNLYEIVTSLGQFILQSCVILAKLQDFGEKRLIFFTLFFQIAPKWPILQRHKKKVCSFLSGMEVFSLNSSHKIDTK